MLLDDDKTIIQSSYQFLNWTRYMKKSFEDQITYYVEQRCRDPFFDPKIKIKTRDLYILKQFPFSFVVHFTQRKAEQVETISSIVVFISSEDLNEIHECTNSAFDGLMDYIETHYINYVDIYPVSVKFIKQNYPYTQIDPTLMY